MKRKFIEWYTRNKEKIGMTFVFIIIIIIINIIIVYLANRTSENNDGENTIQNTYQNIQQSQTVQDEFNHLAIGSSESVLTGDELTNNQINMLKTIEEFTEYCNNGNIENAYNLLSNDCKEEMYNSLNDFKTSYYDKVFGGQRKRVEIENWTENIYKVEIQDDYLTTGTYTEKNAIQDYIRIITDDEENYKLNINGYIGKQEINKTATRNNLEITVLYSDTYMNYQTFTYQVKNNFEHTVVLDDGIDLNSMYVADSMNVQYPAYTHEIAQANITISPKETKNITIKYYTNYSSEKTINRIVFSRAILNYEAYENLLNKSYYNEYGNIQIEI